MNFDMNKRLDTWLRQDKHPKMPDSDIMVVDGFTDDSLIMTDSDEKGAWISCRESDMIEVGTTKE